MGLLAGEGVCVQASTLGSLEALLEFLKSPAVKIPVSSINIGPIHKKDVMRASVMLEKGRRKFCCILAFDVPVTREAAELAEKLGVRIFSADIIYHLFDQFSGYIKQVAVSLETCTDVICSLSHLYFSLINSQQLPAHVLVFRIFHYCSFCSDMQYVRYALKGRCVDSVLHHNTMSTYLYGVPWILHQKQALHRYIFQVSRKEGEHVQPWNTCTC